ncbi:MAG: hypothetical protein ABIF77_17355, partial [bacterium]
MTSRGLIVCSILLGLSAGLSGIPSTGLTETALALPLAEILTSAPSQQDYPDWDAVVLYELVNVTIDGDGISSRRVHRFQKLFTE